MMHTPWTYRCALVRVVDGDTVVVKIDQGFRNTTTQSIRLHDVNTPEIFSGDDRAAGFVAKAHVAQWFDAVTAKRLTEPWPLVVTTLKDKQTFGRYIGDIWDLDECSLNQHLRSLGWSS